MVAWWPGRPLLAGNFGKSRRRVDPQDRLGEPALRVTRMAQRPRTVPANQDEVQILVRCTREPVEGE